MKFTFWCCTFFILSMGSGLVAVSDAEPKPLKIYQKDGFTVNAYDYTGLEYFLKRNNDTTYVVNFWATWCMPCIEELPYFEKLNADYKDKKVKVILVSLDMPEQAESRLIPFMQRKKIQSRVLLLDDPDANAWIDKVAAEWSGAIPATVIYKNDKRKFYEKSFTFAELETEIKQFN